MNELEVTQQGEPFDHILFHSVLPYSNWEWGRVVQSKSLLSIRLGLQSTLLKLGYVPQAHQPDHTTAATHKLGTADRQQSPRERGYNEEYLQLLAHYGPLHNYKYGHSIGIYFSWTAWKTYKQNTP